LEQILDKGGAPGPAVLPSGGERRDLDRSLVRGLAWTGGMKWGAQIATWAASLIVARILTPEDYGLVALATVYLGIVTLLSEFGVGASIVMLRELTDDQIAQLNGVSIVMGIASFLVSCLVAVPLAHFFRAPDLPPVIIVMSLTFVITAFRVVPAALLQKELRFRALAVIDGVQALVLAVAMVIFALLGFGYWTLVIGAVMGTLLSTGMLLSVRPHRFARPRLSAIREAVSFSIDVVVARLGWYLYSNADFVIAGRMFGKNVLGGYSYAWMLACMPVDKISALVVQVTPAFFSAVQEEAGQLRRYLLTLTEGISILTFPAALGLALVADDFVHAVLTDKWAGAIGPLRILAIYATFRSVIPLLAPVLTAIGETRYVMWNNLLALVVLPAAFYFGTRWGTIGLAAAWVVAYPPIALLLMRRVFRRIDLRPAAYLRSLWPAISASAVMVAVVLGVRLLLADTGPAVRLAAAIAAGAGAYLAIIVTVHRARLTAFRAMLRRSAA
jgi:PST family polysaccharide transporter